MSVDASALTAILADEQDARQLLARMQTGAQRFTSPLAIWETVLAVSRNLGLAIAETQVAVEEFLELAGIKPA